VITRREALETILSNAERAGWAGADPYDGLHSLVGRLAIPFGPPARLAVTHAVLRSGRIRAIVHPSPSVNPKGLALFLGAVANSRATLGEEQAHALSKSLVAALRECAASTDDGLGWGYPFPWQSRWFWAPAGTPNVVVTATAGWHLLAAADAFGSVEARAMAEAAGRFLTTGLRWTPAGGGRIAVSYTPRDSTRIINVSGLVARVLARLGDRVRAEGLAEFITCAQEPSGGWPYAQDVRGRWQDSFHTGFLLESLLCLRALGIVVPQETFRRGFAAYRRFFAADGGARLYPSDSSSYDAHSAAQGMATYAALAMTKGGALLADEEPLERAELIADWALRRLWIPEDGYFAYRITNSVRDERLYLRWVQAWMAWGLSVTDAAMVAGDASRRTACAADRPASGVVDRVEVA